MKLLGPTAEDMGWGTWAVVKGLVLLAVTEHTLLPEVKGHSSIRGTGLYIPYAGEPTIGQGCCLLQGSGRA